MDSIFSKFINQYSLSKTLRFELKPVGNTQKMLEDNQVFQIDEVIKDKYEKTKPYIDKLHRDFVADSLNTLSLTKLEKYANALQETRKITRETPAKDKKKITDALKCEEVRLRKEIVEHFDSTANIWAEKYTGLKHKNIDFLFEEKVFEKVLKSKYGEEQETIIEVKTVNTDTGEIKRENKSIFDSWKGFVGYFNKFFETRKNFYKDDGTSTAIATRIIDQNLRRFVENTWLIKNYPKDFLSSLDSERISQISNINDYNRFVLQGNKTKTQGINLYNAIVGEVKYEINQYRQKNKGIKIPFLKTLDKQILSERENFIEEILPSDGEENLKTVLIDLLETGKEKTSTLNKLFSDFTKNQDDYDLEKIYLSKKGFETISRKWTHENQKREWEHKLAEAYKSKAGIKLPIKKESGYTFPEFIPLSLIETALELLTEEDKTIFWKEKYLEEVQTEETIWKQFMEIFMIEYSRLMEREYESDEKIGYIKYAEELKSALEADSLEKTPKFTAKVRTFADSLKDIYQFSKYFAVEKSKEWDESIELDNLFYSQFRDEFYHDIFERIVKPYNLLRNYLTKKPWEGVQKWKLNFDNSTLADGWDQNKESDNYTIILRKKNKYFLGLMRKGSNHLFTEKNKQSFAGAGYEKMVYKLLPGASKMLPKVFFSKSNIKFFCPSQEILDIRNYSTHTKSGTPQKGFTKKEFNIEDCHLMIDFFKSSLSKHKEWNDYHFNFRDTEQYEDISGFYRDVEQGGYKINWIDVSENYIEQKNQNGELYLFQIKNKDWNEGSSGTKNLHTLYFENIFSEENERQNYIFKLNGKAEIFYRPKSIEAKKVQRNFKREIIEKKRYTKDNVFFHVPVTLNRGQEKPNTYVFNQKINEFLANAPNINIIGVDRGEKHLAYYSVVNQKGEILKDKKENPVSGSLNVINDVDYHYLLEKKANEREQQRKNWESIQGIKDLKQGYISQAVYKLADLAIRYNAIIVFEDLNMRFKQIRGGIEKSAYQQFEKALIDKLNFLANKTIDPNEIGGILKAYQLTAPVEAFKDMGKQTGIIFYTTASYTSKIDPITGWRPNVYLKNGNAEVNKSSITKFNGIVFNKEKSRFEFTYDLKKIITNDTAKYPERTVWTVCSNVDRFRWNRSLNNNKGGYEEYLANGKNSITSKLKALLENYGVNISENILEQINTIETKGNEKLFSDLLFYFRLICQIRNTDERLDRKIKLLKESGNYNLKDPEVEKIVYDADFIQSPVEPFFDSRTPKKFGSNLPQNGDDNGAYNIARKGIITLQNINKWAEINQELERENKPLKKSPDLFVSNTDWDNFSQKP